MQDSDLNKLEPVVYVPKNAKLNVDNKNQSPPQTIYHDRRKIFNLDAIKKLVGGIYGKKD